MMAEQKREYFKGTQPEQRAYSRAVKTSGATTIYLAGVGATEDASGKSLVGDFEGQVRASFERVGQTLGEAGGRLADIATMTVFIVDMNNGKRFLELRKEIFKHDFPASALIGISKLARPEMMIEIQAIAVID